MKTLSDVYRWLMNMGEEDRSEVLTHFGIPSIQAITDDDLIEILDQLSTAA